MKNNQTLLVVDDDPRMRRVLSDFLQAFGYQVLEAPDGLGALKVFNQNTSQIDLILLDVMMPNKDGFEVLKEIRVSSKVPIIMLTAKDAEYEQLRGFNLGADDYITKPFSSSLLKARIEAVLRRGLNKGSETFQVGDITIDDTSKTVFLRGTEIKLTQKEFDLLYYFSTHLSKALSRNQLLNALWDDSYMGDGRTIDTHVKQLRAKLKESSTHIETLFGFGYRFVEDK